MNAPPLPVIRRQVTPRRSGPQYPEYCIDKTTVILGDSSPLSSPSRQMGFQQCPYIIAYIMSVIGCFHLFRSCLFMMLPFYHNPLALCRQYLEYRPDKQDCLACSLREQCMTSKHRVRMVGNSYFRPSADKNFSRKNEPEYADALRKRQIWCEGTFSTQKRGHNLRYLLRRGLETAEDHCLLSATAMNLKR